MGALRKTMLTTALVSAMLCGAAVANAESLAVMDVANSAFRLTHPYYGGSKQFRNSVAEVFSDFLAVGLTCVDVNNTEDLRKEVWQKSDDFKHTWVRLFSDDEALQAAQIREYDFVLLAGVTEVEVKESHRYVQGEKFRKYSLWATVEVRVLRVASGTQVFRNTYTGRHELQHSMADEHRREFEYFEESLAAFDSNTMNLSETELGVPFLDVAEQLLTDLQNSPDVAKNTVLAASF